MIDISDLWRQAHPHLELMLTDQSLIVCGVCGQTASFDIMAEIRFDKNTHYDECKVTYCRSCEKWLIDSQTSLVGVPTAVNARLWSQSPTFLNLEPTTRCNFNCWYCVGRHMTQTDMLYDEFVQVLDNCKTIKTIALVGEGEPLLNKDFFRMASLATNRNIKVLTISNGSTFSPENVKNICESGIVYIAVSIDSCDDETFADSRRNGDLSQVLAGIKRLVTYRDEHGFSYPRIGLKGTLFGHTKDQLLNIVSLAKSVGVEIFENFQVLNPMNTYVSIYPEDKLKFLDDAYQVMSSISRDLPVAVCQLKSVHDFCIEENINIFNSGRHNKLRPNCDEGWVYSLVSGDITPCCQIKQPISLAWNLRHYCLDEILTDDLYENIRFNLWNGVFPDYCRGCQKIC